MQVVVEYTVPQTAPGGIFQATPIIDLVEVFSHHDLVTERRNDGLDGGGELARKGGRGGSCIACIIVPVAHRRCLPIDCKDYVTVRLNIYGLPIRSIERSYAADYK